ncbi:hypothetical protein F1737_05020 [Methanoplanus sp. FWC-SCC4]|uniref:Uncharacterized protein n=1 Tax=Methanochimaera problematica TaxID=2609417 RepID=A0AA97I496_9EURY|nr:hypothetical protein [Methanoplanus sp. FWC-SCC4]WOF16111.1 hypothetical protein F1737_05020 [Methanoplanus sp. FWC-SCC4]
MSKVTRIQEDAVEITLKYGNTISEGIRTMEKLLQKQKKGIEIEDVRMVIREELESFGRY